MRAPSPLRAADLPAAGAALPSDLPAAGEARSADDAAASKARLRLWLRILAVSHMVEAELRERLREADTTLPRFDVMAALSRRPEGLRMSELSSVLRVSNGNVTGIVDRLEAEGLAVRLPVESDRRAMLVRLTPQGERDFARLATEHAAWVNDMLGVVTHGEAERLAEQLRAVRDSLAERGNKS